MAFTQKSVHFSERWFQGLVSLAVVIAIFALLTNFVPFVQWGWVSDLGKKKFYALATVAAVSSVSILLVFFRIRNKLMFDRSFPALMWRETAAQPIFSITLLLFTAYVGLTALVGFERYLALETRAFDLGIFAQAVWNTTQGNFLFSSIKENICLLGDHVSPILLFTVPFYKVWPDPRALIFLQSIAAAASLFPLAVLAERKLQNRSLTLILLLMFFFFHSVRSALREDFHPELLAEPFLWWAFLFLEERKIRWFAVFLLIAAMGKENFLGIAFMFGFYAFAWKKMTRVGILTMLVSIAGFVWEMKWLVPHLISQSFFYTANYKQVLAHPISGVFLRLFNGDSFEYVLKIFLPFLYLPFFYIPTLFLVFPILFQNLLSNNDVMRSFNYHYMTGMTPFLFIATIYALDSLRHKSERFQKNILWVGWAMLFVTVLRSGPSEYYYYWHIHSHRNAHTEMVLEKTRDIPRDAVVLTHNNLIPQLCNRKRIYQFDYNAQNSKLDYAKKYQADYVIGDIHFWEPQTQPVEQALSVLQAAGYQMDFSQDGFFILKKKQ